MLTPELENSKEILSWKKRIKKIQPKQINYVFSYFESEYNFSFNIKNPISEENFYEVDVLAYEELFKKNLLKEKKIPFFWKMLVKFDQTIEKYNEKLISEIFFTIFSKNNFPVDMSKSKFSYFLKISKFRDIEGNDFNKNVIVKVNKALLKLRHLLIFLTEYLTTILLRADMRINEISKKDISLLKAAICYNILMRQKFILYEYIFFLIKIKYCYRVEKWKSLRIKYQKQSSIYEDLNTLKERINDSDVQYVLKQLTFKKMKLMGDFSDQKNLDSLEKISFDQFLIHFIYQLEINLEFVFSGKIRDIIAFFDSINEFMVLAFGKVSSELKCDVYRLIFRSSKSCLFIIKLEILNFMKMDYFENNEDFKLFYEVLSLELEY